MVCLKQYKPVLHSPLVQLSAFGSVVVPLLHIVCYKGKHVLHFSYICNTTGLFGVHKPPLWMQGLHWHLPH